MKGIRTVCRVVCVGQECTSQTCRVVCIGQKCTSDMQSGVYRPGVYELNRRKDLMKPLLAERISALVFLWLVSGPFLPSR